MWLRFVVAYVVLSVFSSQFDHLIFYHFNILKHFVILIFEELY